MTVANAMTIYQYLMRLYYQPTLEQESLEQWSTSVKPQKK
jgi:hypothetical protein